MSKKHGPLTSSPIKTVRDGDSPRNTQSNIRTVRQTLENQLQSLAQTGETQQLIKLLEEGAPFVVDIVGTTAVYDVKHTSAYAHGHVCGARTALKRYVDAPQEWDWS